MYTFVDQQIHLLLTAWALDIHEEVLNFSESWELNIDQIFILHSYGIYKDEEFFNND